MSNKVYDILKVIASVAMPVATFLVAVLSGFGIVEAGEIITMIAAAVTALANELLNILSKEYFKNKTIIETDNYQ